MPLTIVTLSVMDPEMGLLTTVHPHRAAAIDCLRDNYAADVERNEAAVVAEVERQSLVFAIDEHAIPDDF